MKRLALFTLAVAVSGCVSVQDQIAAAPTKSSYGLCHNLAVAALADDRVREAWAQELARRGENCAQFAATIQASQASNAQMMRLANQLQQPRSSPAPGRAILRNSYESGLNRICVYDGPAGQVATTVKATQHCPLSQ